MGQIKRQVDLFHDPVSFGQDLDDRLVVADIVKAQKVTLAVFEPFLGGLIGVLAQKWKQSTVHPILIATCL